MNSMQSSTWQKLLFLESYDSVIAWHKQAFSRTLNARRAREITSAARQAREFFRNSAESNVSVKPLLTFYGVASLSRSATLLLSPHGGESALAQGHGITTIEWSKTLSGEISAGLSRLGSLKIKTCKGLFADLIKQTENTICIHVNSSAVGWRISYDIPEHGEELTFDDLLLRLPDLHAEHQRSSQAVLFAPIRLLKCSEAEGFLAEVTSNDFLEFSNTYESSGYQTTHNGTTCNLSSDFDTFNKHTPQFLHSYVKKTFGKIPDLHIAKPLEGSTPYSQIAISYMLSYFLGMLCRYYPTHWTSLFSGEKGDARWPEIYLTQQYIDASFPELILELLEDTLVQKKETAEPTSSTRED